VPVLGRAIGGTVNGREKACGSGASLRNSVPVEDAGPNHVTTNNMQIPYKGTWQLEVLARFGQFEQVRFATTFTVH